MTTITGAIEWLKSLDTQIRKYHLPDGVNCVGFNDKLRNLTKEEWKTIKKIVKEHGLPSDLWLRTYGFSLAIYGHGNSSAPGMKMKPEILLIVEDTQFSFLSAQQGFAGQKEILRKIATITHSEQNKRMLKLYGFAPLDPPSSYAH